jgi:hypothetical protein
MNKYNRQRSKEIKDIMRTDRFGKMDYKQARRKWRKGIRAFPVGDSGNWLSFDCSRLNLSREQLREIGQAYYMIARYAAERRLDTAWEFDPFADGYILRITGRTYTGQRFGFRQIISASDLTYYRGSLVDIAYYIIPRLDHELDKNGFYPPKFEENYILDPCWEIRSDGSMRLREVSLMPNPRKGM